MYKFDTIPVIIIIIIIIGRADCFQIEKRILLLDNLILDSIYYVAYLNKKRRTR